MQNNNRSNKPKENDNNNKKNYVDKQTRISNDLVQGFTSTNTFFAFIL